MVKLQCNQVKEYCIYGLRAANVMAKCHCGKDCGIRVSVMVNPHKTTAESVIFRLTEALLRLTVVAFRHFVQ